MSDSFEKVLRNGNIRWKKCRKTEIFVGKSVAKPKYSLEKVLQNRKSIAESRYCVKNAAERK